MADPTQIFVPPFVTTAGGSGKAPSDQINQITKLVLQDGREVAFTDWTDRMLYSTADLLSGWSDQEIRLFVYSDGDPVQASSNITTKRTATEMDTNLASAGEMDATEEFLCYSIQNELYQVVGTADGITSEISRPGSPMPNAGVMAVMHMRCTVALEVSQKFFPHASFGYFVAGFGPNVVSTATQTSLATNGQPGQHARFDQSVPIHIQGCEKFALVLQNQGVGALSPGDGSVRYPDDDGVFDETAYCIYRGNLRGLHKRPMA
jgi:hypothetical protein